MAAQRQGPRSLQIAVYPNQPGEDFPTAQFNTGDLRLGAQLAQLRAMPPLEEDSPYLQNATPATDVPAILNYNVDNICFRNAALTALFNLSPFLNFLSQVAEAPDPGNRLLTRLQALAVGSRRNEGGLGAAPRRRQVDGLLQAFWQDLLTPAAGDNDHRALNRRERFPQEDGDPEDPGDFLIYLFDRIATTDIVPGQADSDGRLLYLVFDRIFQTHFVPRYVMECACGQIKQKENVLNVDHRNAAYVLDLPILQGNEVELRALLSDYLYEISRRGDATTNCRQCGMLVPTSAWYYKLAYLPEVLILSLSYSDLEQDIIFPQKLDLANVRDDIDLAGADGNPPHTQYKLQSMVINERAALGTNVHFLACLRRNDNTWEQLDDNPASRIDTSLARIRESRRRPRLLFYVRDRAPDGELDPADVQEVENNHAGPERPPRYMNSLTPQFAPRSPNRRQPQDPTSTPPPRRSRSQRPLTGPGSKSTGSSNQTSTPGNDRGPVANNRPFPRRPPPKLPDVPSVYLIPPQGPEPLALNDLAARQPPPEDDEDGDDGNGGDGNGGDGDRGDGGGGNGDGDDVDRRGGGGGGGGGDGRRSDRDDPDSNNSDDDRSITPPPPRPEPDEPQDADPRPRQAITTNPNDPKVRLLANWPIATLRAAFRDIGLLQTGIKRTDPESWRDRLRAHYKQQVDRDYSMYNVDALRAAVRRVDGEDSLNATVLRTEMVGWLTRWDQRRAGTGGENVEGSGGGEGAVGAGLKAGGKRTLIGPSSDFDDDDKDSGKAALPTPPESGKKAVGRRDGVELGSSGAVKRPQPASSTSVSSTADDFEEEKDDGRARTIVRPKIGRGQGRGRPRKKARTS